MANLVGQRLGNYTILTLLGSGGFADVYLARHIHLETLAAIKVLRSRLGVTDADTFRREARTLAQLQHPHIIRVLDFDIADQVPYLVMEYAAEGSLRQQYPRGTELSPAMVSQYIAQIADALQHAHDHGVIHRDIKPENIFLNRRYELLLGDFGLSIHSTSYTTLNQHSQQVGGTIAYMAPEQLHGQARRASDQYALGIIAFEWLTGQLPFRGTFTEILTQHLSAPPPPLPQFLRWVAPELEQVINRALAKEPTQRFPTVRAFADALAQALQKTQPAQSNPVKTSEELLHESNALYQAGRYQETIDLLSRLLQRWPDNVDAYLKRGLAYIALHDFQHAIIDCNHALILAPRNAIAYNNRGRAYFFLGDYLHAITDHTRAIELSPTLAVAYAGRAHAYEQLGKESQAFHDYQQALHYDPNYEWVKTQLAQWLQRQQQNVDDRS